MGDEMREERKDVGMEVEREIDVRMRECERNDRCEKGEDEWRERMEGVR